jgi:ubiquinone/menaquinone biosynthesis C-methylase UbiE
MDPRIQRRVQRYGWDRSTPHYEQSWDEQLQPARKLLFEMSALRPGESVLDLACGTGLVSFPAADMIGSSGQLLGTDISDAMIEVCRSRAEERGMTQARFERMEAEELRFDEKTFDAVLCGLGLMYVTDFLGSIREMHRVTKPGGRAVSAVWGKRDRCGWAEIFSIVDRRVSTDVCPLFFQLGTGETQQTWFTQAGFENVRTERIQTLLEYESDEEACAAAFAGGPVAMAYSRFDETTRKAAHAEYLESIESFRNGNGYGIPGEFVVTAGEKNSRT